MTSNKIPCEDCLTRSVCSAQVHQAKHISHEEMVNVSGSIYHKCSLIRKYLQDHYSEHVLSGIRVDCKPMIEHLLRGIYVIPTEYAVR